MKTWCLFGGLWLMYAASHGQPYNCDLKKQADGINVYTCKTEDKKFKTLKAEYNLVNTTIIELKNFLLLIENYPSWQYNMIQAELVERISDNEMNYMSYVDAPWPVDDREMIVNFKVTHETAHELQIDIHTLPSERPVRDGFIRVPFMHGHWNVIRDNQLLRVEYVLEIDPGGSVPAWLVNMAMAEGPYVSFKNLKQQLEK